MVSRQLLVWVYVCHPTRISPKKLIKQKKTAGISVLSYNMMILGMYSMCIAEFVSIAKLPVFVLLIISRVWIFLRVRHSEGD